VTTFHDIVHRHADLGDADREWLRLLVADWQLVSDLSFADLVLWLRDRSGGWSAIAHARPSTASTAFYDDMVGATAKPRLSLRMDHLAGVGGWEAARDGEDGRWEDLFTVVRNGRAIGVVERVSDPSFMRVPGRLELMYQEAGDLMLQMMSEAGYPYDSAPTGPRRGAPRVGDGFVRLDSDGVVTYVSPNGVSAFRRLGVASLLDRNLAEVVTAGLAERDPVDESLPVVITGRAPWRCDLDIRGSVLSLRALPLTRGTGRSRSRIGAVLLVRDVTEIRRSERELMTKEATIREIHHRVKNNLQTVSALLRMQARRTESGEARQALGQAGRRISAIALVYDALARGFDESVDFDHVVDSSLAATVEIAAGIGRSVALHREGSFGRLVAADATALSLVLTELVSNAAEHGFSDPVLRDEVRAFAKAESAAQEGLTSGPSPLGGSIVVRAQRRGKALTVEVDDNGRGISGSAIPGLGTRIVETLVQTELNGTFQRGPRPGGGTRASVRVTLQ